MYKLGESASGTMDLVTSGFIRWMLRPPPPPEGVPAARMIGAYTKLMLNAFALTTLRLFCLIHCAWIFTGQIRLGHLFYSPKNSLFLAFQKNNCNR
ncbi:hypothetical protein DN752_09165 [Echinicola strongylocentroti]|uniref:Uncharacterized protein n=1 Tax=Echinicola strongylocentroti TaxID=1795355 RepID=A0A2Z4IID4_9BACT|nr:hypothetical protein DN752_09165 [Echinicola strongylocentroti]